MTSGYPDWLRAFLLLGKYDSSYLPVLLGPDGSMYAVLQGEYEGALKTIKLDDEGRLYTYIADLPDMYGQTVSIGIAELAARLGWATTRDRRGQLVWHDGFEHGQSMWEMDGDGTGHAAALSPLYYNGGEYSLKLTGGSDGDMTEDALTFRSLPPGQAKGLGLSFSTLGDPGSVEITFDIYDGSLYWHGLVRHTLLTYLTELYASDGLWHTITSAVRLFQHPAVFHYLKLVINHVTGLYVRLLLDESEFDLSAYQIYSQASAQNAGVRIKIRTISTPGQNYGIYLDDVILTTQEP